MRKDRAVNRPASFAAAGVQVWQAGQLVHSDILDLRAFYRSPLGQTVTRSLSMGLTPIWKHMPDERLVGIGYARPLLDRFASDAERAFAFMPATQGAVAWPDAKHCATALVFDEDLPLPDSSVDRILAVHAFEHAESPQNYLSEMWRVLAPNGRLILVLPNRRGVWARFDHTPFGFGRPYTKGQISSTLSDAGYTVETWSEALFYPPSERFLRLRLSGTIGRSARRFWPAFSGVIMVEAVKKLHRGTPALVRSSRRVFVPALNPQGVGARVHRD
ncbi:MAG: class I SAM-dependent methyltransferase [Pseudomonadota bacterium]